MAQKRRYDTYTGKPPGSGANFRALVAKFKREGLSDEQARARAAAIGFNKYGKKRMLEMAAAGRKRKS